MQQTTVLTLSEALARYVASLKEETRQQGHQELARFVQWCGRDRKVTQIAPQDVAEYAELAGHLTSDSLKRLEPVKGFLSYLKQKGLVETSLAPHLKVSRKSTKRSPSAASTTPVESIQLSSEGYTQIKARLDLLKEERLAVVADIQRAMADKDFRENAPLDAAKERQGFIETSIRELEGLLGRAVVSEQRSENATERRIGVGKKVSLKDLDSGRVISYILVAPQEANPSGGKISTTSPVGKALMDRRVGEKIEIAVPRGVLRYYIEGVEG